MGYCRLRLKRVCLRAVILISVFTVLARNYIFPGYNPSYSEIHRRESKYPQRIRPYSDGNSTDPEKVNAARVKQMMQYCAKLNTPRRKLPSLHRLFIIDRYKLIYCQTPKVASTMFIRLIIALGGASNATALSWSEMLNTVKRLKLQIFKKSEISKRLENYTKVIAVRDPLERVLSAFRSKLERPGNPAYGPRFRTPMIKRLHPEWSTDDRNKKLLTFKEFVDFIVHPKKFPNPHYGNMDEHWDRYTEICQPCSIKYNVVLKYEMMENDVKFLLNKLKASDVFTWPKRPDPHQHVPTSAILAEAIKNISRVDMESLLNIYYNDYKMFGYEFNVPGRDDVTVRNHQAGH